MLLLGWGRIASRLAFLVVLHTLLAMGLHFIPLLLLVRIEQGANLRGGGLVDIHHFAAPILWGRRSVLVQAFHLRVFGLEEILHFGLLVGGEVEFSGELLGACAGSGGP